MYVSARWRKGVVTVASCLCVCATRQGEVKSYADDTQTLEICLQGHWQMFAWPTDSQI